MSEKLYRCSPPWQVLVLIANHLDAKTLATASCVSKSWSICMSSDHLWQPICAEFYPSLFNLRKSNAALSYHKLYALGHVSEKRRLQMQTPLKPRIRLEDILFSVDIYSGKTCLLTTVKPGGELVVDRNSVFRFDINFGNDVVENNNNNLGGNTSVEELGNMRITWNVVLTPGYKSAFTMMDCKGKGNFVLGLEGWFSKELPSSAGCCSSSAASGLVADLRLGMREKDGKLMVEKISVGVLNIVSWRYVCIDDALRYLQHFLLPHNRDC